MSTEPKKRSYSTRKLLGRNASTTSGPLPCAADQTNWRKKMKASRIKFGDEAKEIFLEEFSKHNLMTVSAKAAGVTVQCVKNHLENDQDFLTAFQACRMNYRDRVIGHAQKLIFDGIQEPIVGGKNRDEIIAHRTTYPVNLIAMEMRKVDPDYKERSEVEHKGSVASLLVVPADIKAEEWLEKLGAPSTPVSDKPGSVA